MEKGFCLALSQRIRSIMADTSRQWEHEAVAHIILVTRKQGWWMPAAVLLSFSIYITQDPRQGVVGPTVGGLSQFNQPNQDCPPWRCPKSCLSDNSQICQIDNTNRVAKFRLTSFKITYLKPNSWLGQKNILRIRTVFFKHVKSNQICLNRLNTELKNSDKLKLVGCAK